MLSELLPRDTSVNNMNRRFDPALGSDGPISRDIRTASGPAEDQRAQTCRTCSQVRYDDDNDEDDDDDVEN